MLPNIGTPRDSNDSWNLGRRRPFTSSYSSRGSAQNVIVQQQPLYGPDLYPRIGGNGQDSEAIRSILEEMRHELTKDTTALKEQYQYAMKRLIGVDPAGSMPVSENLQEQVRGLQAHVAELRENAAAVTRGSQSNMSRRDIEAICAEEVRRSLLDRNVREELRPLILDTVQSEVHSLERRFRTQMGTLLDKQRSADIVLDEATRQIGTCMASTRDLEVEIRRLSTQQRVGTARAEDWLSRARRKLDDFGRSLKDCNVAAGSSSAEELLEFMTKAEASLNTPSSSSASGMLARDASPKNTTGTDGAAPLSDYSLERYLGSLTQDSSGFPRERCGLDSSGELRNLSQQVAAPGEQEHVLAKARGALEAVLLSEDAQVGPRSHEEAAVVAKAQLALEAYFFDAAEADVMEDEIRAKARGALESFLLDVPSVLEDEIRAKARGALESFLLDVPSSDEEARLANKARGALEALFLDGLQEDQEQHVALVHKARGALEVLFLVEDTAR